LPDPFGVVDRSGETRSIDLLVPGATQSIEWKVDDEFRFANIYLYNKGTLYKTIDENIDNVGKYEWKSEEALEMAHNYEVIVSQHNGKPDENPYLTGYKSSEFSIYPSAIESAKFLIERMHSDATNSEKEIFMLGYVQEFSEHAIKFLGRTEEIGERNDYWLYVWSKIRDKIDDATDDDGNFNVVKFFASLSYMDIYSTFILESIRFALSSLGFSSNYDDDGNLVFYNNDTQEMIVIMTQTIGTATMFPDFIIDYWVGGEYILTITFVVSSLGHGESGEEEYIVEKRIFIVGGDDPNGTVIGTEIYIYKDGKLTLKPKG